MSYYTILWASEASRAQEYMCVIATRQVVGSISTGGNEIFNIFISSFWCRGKGKGKILRKMRKGGSKHLVPSYYPVVCEIQWEAKKNIYLNLITVLKYRGAVNTLLNWEEHLVYHVKISCFFNKNHFYMGFKYIILIYFIML